MGHSPLPLLEIIKKGGVTNCWPLSTTSTPLILIWLFYRFPYPPFLSYKHDKKHDQTVFRPSRVFLFNNFFLDFSSIFLIILLLFTIDNNPTFLPYNSFYPSLTNYNPKLESFMQVSFHKDHGKSWHTKISHIFKERLQRISSNFESFHSLL